MGESISVRPEIHVLSEEAITRLHGSSLRILSEIGVRVDSSAARKILKAAPGVKFIDEQRATFQPEVVEWVIQQAPSKIDVYNRRGEFCFHLGDDQTRFGIGVTNLFFQDPQNDQVLPFTRQHMRLSVGLGNRLPEYDVISTIGILSDVEPRQADLLAVLEMVANTFKPLIMLISDQQQFAPALALLEQLTGELAAKSFVIPYFNPVTPLILNQSTADNMLVSIGKGLPLIFSNYGMAGVTTPITSAGSLALLNAELLAGLVFSQLAKPGTPVILGSLPAFFDMQTMLDFYDPQTMLLNLACAELMAHYHIPQAGTSGSSNGWGADLIAGATLCINQLTSCLGKVDLAPFVGGTFGSKVFSPQVAVYAHELIEQARQFSKGFIIDEQTIPIDELKKVGVGGNFIASRQTMKLFRTAYHSSSIFPRLSLEKWQEISQPEAMQYLRLRTIDLLDQPNPPDDREDLLEKGKFWISRFSAGS